MAHYASQIALALLVCATASAAPFSHKTHLKLKLACATCHAKATASTSRSDNLLPSNAVCAGCHKDERAKTRIKAPRATLVARFSHAQHLKLGNAAPVIAKAVDSGAYLSPPGDIRRHLDTKNLCAACHRGLDEADSVSAAHFPRMSDCLVCHNRIEPPFSCETCHVEVRKLVPASHTPQWVDIHSRGGMDKTTCAGCHGRNFRCQGCH